MLAARSFWKSTGPAGAGLPNTYSLPSLISQLSGLATTSRPLASAMAQKLPNCGA
jgi:hypothetical protein